MVVTSHIGNVVVRFKAGTWVRIPLTPPDIQNSYTIKLKTCGYSFFGYMVKIDFFMGDLSSFSTKHIANVHWRTVLDMWQSHFLQNYLRKMLFFSII